MLLSPAATTRLFRAITALAGLAVVMGVLVVLRYARIPFFMYYPRFTDTVLFSESLDTYLFMAASLCVPASLVAFAFQRKAREQTRGLVRLVLVPLFLIWLLSLAFISQYPLPSAVTLLALTVGVLVFNVLTCDRVYGLERRQVLSEVVMTTMTPLALIEFAPVYYWIFSSMSPGTEIGRGAAELELNLAYSLFPLAPFIFIALLLSWLWVPVACRVLARVRPSRTPQGPDKGPRKLLDLRALVASVDLIAIVAIVIFYYPYFAGQGWLVGVDSYINYHDPLVGLSGLKLSDAVRVLSSTFHGTYVGLLFLAQRATGLGPFVIVKFAPLALVFLTSVMILSIVLMSTRKHRLAVLSGLCMILWIPATAGIFCGFQANLAAFVLWMLFVAFMLKSLKLDSKRATYLLLQAILSAGILLIHPWTWGVFIVTVAIFTVMLSLGKAPEARASAISLFSAVALAIPLGIGGMLLAPGVRKDMLSTATMYMQTITNPAHLSSVWNGVLSMFASWSSFLSPLILMLSLMGTVSVIEHRDPFSRYLLAWVAAWSIGSVLAAPLGYYSNNPGLSDPAVWRTLFVSPVSILLAFSLESILEASKHLELLTRGHRPAAMQKSFAAVGAVVLGGAFTLVFSSPILRLTGVLAAIILVFLLTRFVPVHQAARILVASVLVLIVLNGAFRSLYPLLLDPHNLMGRWG
jgi:hypothetical protein